MSHGIVPLRIRTGYDADQKSGKKAAMSTLEEKIAHLERTTDEMSAVIARQDKEIALLTRRVQMLMEAEAHRQSQGGEHIFAGNERPPHY